MTTGSWFQNRSELKPVSVLSPIGENHTRNRNRSFIDPETGIELVTVWDGTMDAREECPRLSGYQTLHEQEPLQPDPSHD